MSIREGSLEAPQRQPIDWQGPDFVDETALYSELERTFNICHGCRRCVSLCQSFPTLFDLVDESETLEVDGVDAADYMKVVDQCYLCDLCAQTKCPYLPPHEWAIDFPHLMLRAKTYKFQHNGTKWRDRLIASTDPLFDAASLPGVAQAANAAANVKVLRKLGDKAVGIHAEAPLPRFHSKTLSKRIAGRTARDRGAVPPRPSETTRGKVALFVTCYGDHIEPEVVEDLIAVLEHNGIPVTVLTDTQCCGMPKLELGDLDAVAAQKDKNLPAFLRAVDQGLDLMSIIPSCTLMYRQEVPLMFPDEDDVARVADAFFDPFEYLWLRSKDDLINTAFVNPLGKVAYHAACHQRVQNFGPRTRDVLSMIPGTDVTLIDRCSGHDGTYAVKSETYAHAMKIARPVVNRVKQAEAQIYGSDCPMAGRMIAHGMNDGSTATHPISMLRKAYGI